MGVYTGRVLVLRGLPGTGKDDFIEWLLPMVPDSNKVVLSSDDFFKQPDGTIKFDQTKMQEAHKWNYQRYKEAIDKKVPLIIINNTNIKRFHYYHYVDYAQRHDYHVNVVICPHNDISNRELAARTPHNIDQDVIRRMRNSFEWSMEEKPNE